MVQWYWYSEEINFFKVPLKRKFVHYFLGCIVVVGFNFVTPFLVWGHLILLGMQIIPRVTITFEKALFI